MAVKNLYESLGFKFNPFSKFSAEEEISYLNNIYYKPKYFQSLYNDISCGSSRFIFGERGSGKSALVIELNKALAKENIFSVIIDDYDDVPIENNDFQLALLIFKKVLKQYIFSISKNPQQIKKLSSIEKEKLALYIKEFFNPVSTKEFVEAVNKVTRIKSKNFAKKIYNDYFNKPLNLGVSGLIEVSSDWIRRSFNLGANNGEVQYKNYFPEFSYDEISRTGLERQLTKERNYKRMKDLVVDLMGIIKSSGFSATVVFFDKIDEFKKITGKINKIVEFTLSILKDTELLYQNDFGLVFSLWSEVRYYLNEKGVRFDKFKPVDINWSNEEMVEILKKRVLYFSKPESSLQLSSILPPNFDIGNFIQLCNKSPRDMIRLFSTVYDEQEITNPNVSFFSIQVVQKAAIKFCKEYDYYSLYPSEKGTKEDIISLIERLLKQSQTTFSFNQFMTFFSFNREQAKYYLGLLTDCSLIKNDLSHDETLYAVQDPKIAYLIANGYRSLS